MDGGRVIRAGCTYLLRGDWWLATQIAWGIGILTTLLVMPFFCIFGSWFGAVVLAMVTFGLAPYEIKHLKTKRLAEEAEAVHERYKESHPESYNWITQMSEHIVAQAVAHSGQFELTGNERDRTRQYAERCWSVLAPNAFDDAHQAWFDRAREKPGSLASKTFIVSLALPRKAKSG